MLDRRLLIVSGKGGVGKSALTAAIALLGARRGKRVLGLGMVDGVGLAAHLGAEELDYRAREIRPGLFALAADRWHALDEYLRIQLHAPRLAPTAALTRGLAVLADTVPGIREIITMGKPVFEVWRDEWDLVVADAPPLGQLMSYLRAPATITDLVPSGRIREQSEALRNTLADPEQAGLVLVATAEELPVTETQEALAALAAEAVVDLAAVVVNATLSPLALDEATVATLPAGPHRDAALLHAGVHESQQVWQGRLPPGPRLPFLFGLHTPAEVTARLADEWEAAS